MTQHLLQLAFGLFALLAGLPSSSWAATVKYTLEFDGYDRSYLVARPESCRASCPVVLDLHGFLGSAKSQQQDSGLDKNGAANGYIVVYANGVQRSWNGGSDYGSCCGFAVEHDLDDVGFLREVVSRVAAAYPVDPARVYVSGWSNGCAMAQRLAVEASDVFAAVACTGEYLLKATRALARPVPATEIHALNDRTIRYRHTQAWPGAVNNGKRWAQLNACRDVPTRTYLTAASYVDTHDSCAGGVAVRLYSLANSQHDTYHHPDGLDIAQIIWDNLAPYRLP